MKIHWKPDSELPLFECPTTLLLAWPQDADGVACLGGIYMAQADGSLMHEADGHIPERPFFWVLEDDLLETLPCLTV